MSQPSAKAWQGGVGNPAPAPMKAMSSAIPVAREARVDAGEAELERHGDVVAERERRGARSAFAAVDGDEVRSGTGRGHPLDEPVPERSRRRPP